MILAIPPRTNINFIIIHFLEDINRNIKRLWKCGCLCLPTIKQVRSLTLSCSLNKFIDYISNWYACRMNQSESLMWVKRVWFNSSYVTIATRHISNRLLIWILMFLFWLFMYSYLICSGSWHAWDRWPRSCCLNRIISGQRFACTIYQSRTKDGE